MVRRNAAPPPSSAPKVTAPPVKPVKRSTPYVRQWAAEVERRSLAAPADLLRQGRSNWRSIADDPAAQARLAKELCVTRSPELTLAYRNLVWLLPGFRQVTRAGRRKLTSEICVVLVVRNKGSVPDGHRQHLPAALLTYAAHDGERKLFAVPTDVQDAAEFATATAHSDSGVWVRRSSWPYSPGSFACLVVLSQGERSDACLLSAQHVFTPYADAGATKIDADWPVFARAENGSAASSQVLAKTLPYGGILRDDRDGRLSFDVQLAEPDQAVIPRIALRNFHPERPWVTSMKELLALDAQAANAFLLLTPDNHPKPRGEIPLSLSHMPDDDEVLTVVPIRYKLSRNGAATTCTVLHDGLLVFKAGGNAHAVGGDSGAPVVVKHADDTMTLVGMHIAGNDAGLSWAIPAWQLFSLDFWTNSPRGATLTPMDVPGE